MLNAVRGIFRAAKEWIFSHEIPLEKRLADIFFITGFVVSSAFLVVNLLIGIPFLMNTPCLVTAAICVFLPKKFPCGQRWPIRFALLFVAFVFFPYLFFIRGGTHSSISMCFVMIVVYMVVMFHGKTRIAIVSGIIVSYLILLVLGYRYPAYFHPYSSEISRVIDYGVTFVMTASVTALIGSYTVDIYEYDRTHIEELINQLETKNAELLKLTNHDSLTGVFNRRYFMEVLGEEMLTHRENNMDLCVLMMDLDHFKNINDTHGHSAGDEVLKLFASSVKECLRRHDVLARYGGEEFVILLPLCSLDNGVIIAERIRKDIETLRYRRDIRFTVSIGISSLAPDDTELGLIDRADQNLYAAKKAGRNLVVSSIKAGETNGQTAI